MSRARQVPVPKVGTPLPVGRVTEGILPRPGPGLPGSDKTARVPLCSLVAFRHSPVFPRS
jgi:hypothetical protein